MQYLFIKKVVKSKLFLRIISYGSGNVTTALSTLILLPLYIKYIGIKEYGILSLALSIPFILNLVMSLTLENAIVRYYYDWKLNNVEKKSLFTIWFFMVIWALALSVFLFFFKKLFFNYLVFNITDYRIYDLIIFSSLISININFLGKLFRIKEEVFNFNFITLSSIILKFVFSFFLVIFYQRDAITILYGNLLSDIIILIPIFYFLYKNFIFKFYLRSLLQSYKLQIPSLAGQIFSNFISISDRFILDKYFTGEQIGLYFIATKIASLILMFINIIQLGLVPFFAKIDTTLTNGKLIINKINLFLFDFIFIVAVFFLFYTNDILFIFHKYLPITINNYVPLLITSYYFQSLLIIPYNEFYIYKKLQYQTYSSFLYLVLIIFLCSFLLKLYGLFGLVISYVLANFIILSMNIFIINKFNAFKLKFPYTQSFFIISTALLFILTPFFINSTFIYFIMKSILFIFFTYNLIKKNENLLILQFK